MLRGGEQALSEPKKTKSTDPRVLLCTAYRRFRHDYWDIAGQPFIHRFPRVAVPLRISPGLRFIKQNVPEVEILEYPEWPEYVEKLRQGWDIIGFSFYQHQINEIRRMIEEARRQRVREIWAGNFGAMDYTIPGLVDRVILGPGEDAVAQLFGYRVSQDEIEHPALLVHLSILPGIRHFTFGLLHTERGCPYRCSFCPTPVFEPRRTTVNLESIDRLLAYYRKIGVRELVLTDELFGSNPQYTDRLTDLFSRYRFRWWAQSRVEFSLRNLDVWYERGMRAAPIGVESMSQTALDSVNKQQRLEKIIEFARRIREKPGLLGVAYFIIGYENMTAEETLRDAVRYKALGFDVNGATILTPYPRTPLWDELDRKYGIFDSDYSHYDQTHLVWHHPHISPAEMRDLRALVKNFLNRPFDVLYRGIKRAIWEELRKQGGPFFWRALVKGPIASLGIDDRRPVYFSRTKKPV